MAEKAIEKSSIRRRIARVIARELSALARRRQMEPGGRVNEKAFAWKDR